MIPVRDRKSACAADALFGLRPITVKGKTVGITGLGVAIAAVQAKDLPGDNQIIMALLAEAEKCNFIPAPLREEYGAALLGEYRTAQKISRTEKR